MAATVRYLGIAIKLAGICRGHHFLGIKHHQHQHQHQHHQHQHRDHHHHHHQHHHLPWRGSAAVIMFLASNICWVNSGTEQARYWALPLSQRSTFYSGISENIIWSEVLNSILRISLKAKKYIYLREYNLLWTVSWENHCRLTTWQPGGQIQAWRNGAWEKDKFSKSFRWKCLCKFSSSSPGEGNHVHSEFPQVCVQLAREPRKFLLCYPF